MCGRKRTLGWDESSTGKMPVSQSRGPEFINNNNKPRCEAVHLKSWRGNSETLGLTGQLAYLASFGPARDSVSRKGGMMLKVVLQPPHACTHNPHTYTHTNTFSHAPIGEKRKKKNNLLFELCHLHLQIRDGSCYVDYSLSFVPCFLPKSPSEYSCLHFRHSCKRTASPSHGSIADGLYVFQW